MEKSKQNSKKWEWGFKNFSQRNKYENPTQSFPSKIPTQRGDFSTYLNDYLQGFKEGNVKTPGLGRLFSPNDRQKFPLINKLKPLEEIIEMDSKDIMRILAMSDATERDIKLREKVTAIVMLINSYFDKIFDNWHDIKGLQRKVTDTTQGYKSFSAETAKEEMTRSYLMAVIYALLVVFYSYRKFLLSYKISICQFLKIRLRQNVIDLIEHFLLEKTYFCDNYTLINEVVSSRSRTSSVV